MSGALPDHSGARVAPSSPSVAHDHPHQRVPGPAGLDNQSLNDFYAMVRWHEGAYMAAYCKECGVNSPRDNTGSACPYFQKDATLLTHIRSCNPNTEITKEQLSNSLKYVPVSHDDIARMHHPPAPVQDPVVPVVKKDRAKYKKGRGRSKLACLY